MNITVQYVPVGIMFTNVDNGDYMFAMYQKDSYRFVDAFLYDIDCKPIWTGECHVENAMGMAYLQFEENNKARIGDQS